MKNLNSKIQTVSNVAIIIVALLFGAILIKRYLLSFDSPQPAAANESIKTGMKLPLAEFYWDKGEKTLLLILSTTCRYCTESTPFYQELARQKAGRNDVRLVALMPQTVEEAQSYLSEHKISVDEIRQTNLDDVSVRGTPTLVMVDKTGAVVQSWVGKLPPEKESEVIARFTGGSSGL